MTAEEHLTEVQRLATARLKAAKAAAAHEGLVLVDGARLAILESLLDAVVDCITKCREVREYESLPGDGYNGKRYLVQREPFTSMYSKASALRKSMPCVTGIYADR